MVHFQQKQVLALREELLPSSVTEEERSLLDGKTFERLRHVSPEGLIPILIQRNHEDWIAAFLIQEVGLSSKRFLVKASQWRIQWAKKSAKMLRVPDDPRILGLFGRIVSAQEERFKEMEQLQEIIQSKKNGQSQRQSRGQKKTRVLSRKQTIGTAS